VFTRDATLADFVASLGKLPLAHQPGEVWEYSWGVDVLARVVEVASGQPFNQYQDQIFGPLHMIDTDFYVPEAKLGRLVDPPPEGRNALWDVTKQPRLFSGGGGLVSTAADYLRFCQMLLNGGELMRILAPETVQLMTTNSLPRDIRFAQDIIGPASGSSRFAPPAAVALRPDLTASAPGANRISGRDEEIVPLPGSNKETDRRRLPKLELYLWRAGNLFVWRPDLPAYL
jgi:CubicO group peptidase (beta-lactamase class C family)